MSVENLNENLPKGPKKERGPGKFVLRDFLSYNNPRLQEYHRLAERLGSEWSPKAYSKDWYKLFDPKNSERYKKAIDLFKSKLGGKLLVDLGGYGSRTHFSFSNEDKVIDPPGTFFAALMGEFAEKMGAQTYICVDTQTMSREGLNLRPLGEKVDLMTEEPYASSVDYESRLKQAEHFRKGARMADNSETQLVMVQSDMLDFIARMPDNSGNFTLNGIDTYIIDLPVYHKALADELERVTAVGGIIFGDHKINAFGRPDFVEFLKKKTNLHQRTDLSMPSYNESWLFEKVQ